MATPRPDQCPPVVTYAYVSTTFSDTLLQSLCFPSIINYLEVLPFLYRARVFETMMGSIDDEESVLYNVLPPCHPDV